MPPSKQSVSFFKWLPDDGKETKECVNSLGKKEASLGIPLREYSGEEEEGGEKFNVFK